MGYKEIAERLEKNKLQILERWEERAKNEIPALKHEDNLTIRDHLIFYFYDLISAFKRLESSGEPRESGTHVAGEHSSEEHGRLRASIKGYDIDQLIHEYALLRQVITDYLSEQNCLSIDLLETLNRNNEQALLVGATEFANSIARTQEKITATLVHDIRNPLLSVQMSLELLRKNQNNPQKQEELIAKGLSSLSRVDQMTSEILDSMRMEAGHVIEMKFRHIELKENLRPTFESIELTFPDRVKLELTPEKIEGTFGLEGIVRTLENLTSNAVKYGDPEREIVISLTTDGNDVVIEVHNWGEPISAKKTEDIFVSFNRSGSAKRYSTKGWGLGLAFVRAAAEAHQGKIEFQSTLEHGTTFRVRFPKEHPDRQKLGATA